ncbi:MAG: WecB/TagA/CpsF family glycosyltransferase [Prevotella sp.]|nr:WecB/TagA/CpsF family glycosyltransferase [Prevotella sp.]MBP3843991.1 WecB/TagA/CpsF family glycosyltransferase [Prevotella sp.]
MEIFNIKLEFDHDAFRNTVNQCIAEHGKGYVCVVDGNVLSMTYKDPEYREVVKNALVNTCDSSYVAKMAGDIYGEKFVSLNGPMLFREYIKKPYKQLLLGNTEETYQTIVNKLQEDRGEPGNLKYLPVPFANVEDFDYAGIAKQVNEISPDIIWVSLGAPKQERFMSRLLPFIDGGVMFGIGAAFNYYSGQIKETKTEIGGVRLIWLQRIFEEPKKQIRRCWNFLMVIPKLKKEEKQRKNIKEATK